MNTLMSLPEVARHFRDASDRLADARSGKAPL